LQSGKIAGGKIFLQQAKSGQPVWMPLPKKVLKALAACDLGDGRFFWSGTGKIKTTITEWQVRLKKLFAIAGIPDGHGHRFRHTLAKELLEKGIPLEMVAAILGNTVKICEKHYSHWQKSRQDQLEKTIKSIWV
jgi:integrase